MKKQMTSSLLAITVIACVIAAAGLTGCMTSATATTRATQVDGTVTESTIRVLGTGDKASEIVTEGLFADGTPDAFGAGVSSAKANQTSTGIDGTLAGMGDLLGGIASLIQASQAMQTIKAGPVAPSDVTSPTGSTGQAGSTAPYSFTAATSTYATAPRTVVSGEGQAEVAIIGNRATCGLCRSLWEALDAHGLSTALDGATIIDADASANPTEYAKRRPATAFRYPLVRVYSAGVAVGEFTAIGFTQDQLAARVRTLLQPTAATPATN